MSSEVMEEIKKGVERGYRDAFIRMELIRTGRIQVLPTKQVETLRDKYQLTTADASSLGLALEHQVILATEDEYQRKMAYVEGIHCTNTGALIYYACKQGNLRKKQALQLLDLLEKWGYRGDAILKVKERILLEVN
ncbi:MAG TPA: hypothetical protein VJH22_04330 [Candidatus Nanoarchaeia archaeon]|nr:hypothetical protein [Candidatus Nanoarchaeia archaeon]